MKSKALISLLSVVLLLIIYTSLCLAAKQYIISGGETVHDDVWAATETLKNDGVVKGDLITAARSVLNNGDIEGDMISAASDITVYGSVWGDMRSAAGNLIIAGNVGKNVNAFAGNTNINNTSTISGNLIAFSGNLSVDGKVKGNTKIKAGNVTLGGEFFGDVNVNVEPNGKENTGKSLIVLPGAIIHGKLTYKGINEADIQSGSQIQDFQWIRPEVEEKAGAERNTVDEAVKKFIKVLLTGAVYFWMAALIYKVFPAIIMRQAETIGKKPLNIIGIGLITLISTVASLIATIFLLIMSAFMISPSVGLIFGAAALLFYVLIFYFSTIPVSLWLGGAILREGRNAHGKMALGLTIITVVLFILGMLSKLDTVGSLFGFLEFIATFAVLVMGTGALVYSLRDIYIRLKNGHA